MNTPIRKEITGKPIDRVDGKLKVTGKASYSAEFEVERVCHGVMVMSAIPKGHVLTIDSGKAKKVSGFIDLLTYENSMNLHFLSGSDPGGGKFGEKDLLPLQSNRIFYDGQCIAVAIAETLEAAEQAASLVQVTYRKEDAVTSLAQGMPKAYKPKSGLGGQQVQQMRGDTAAALQQAAQKNTQTYTTPVYHHNAMEPHATIAEWKGDKLMVYDATQNVYGTKLMLASMLGVEPENVRVVSLYIGGGFGSKGFSWPNTVITTMAASLVNRPVKLVLSRQQMFSTAGRRSQTIQEISLGSDAAGKLSALKHDTISETSFVDEFVEPSGVASMIIYDTPNAEISQRLVRVNKGTPCPMRAPGEATGSFALEVAMDELAVQLNIDPVELRLQNYAEQDPQKMKPFSAKYLRACYDQGREAIGWKNRVATPGSMKEGKWLIGYGMATATYPANRSASTAKAILFSDGRAVIECCTQDIGTGTYTVMTQIAADAFSLPVDQVTVKLGDSDFPKGANSGGSQVSASVGPAIRAAAIGVVNKLLKAATESPASVFYHQPVESIDYKNGAFFLTANPAKTASFSAVLDGLQLKSIEAQANTDVSTRQQTEAVPPTAGSSEAKAKEDSKSNQAVQEDEKTDRKPYSFHSFGAQFVKVRVDPELFTVHIEKAVAVMDIGTVLNLKTAKNQIMGGMIFGIGMALMEETQYDPNRTRVVTRDLANYLVPVHADMPEFEIQFIDKPDNLISPIGARGIGEIGITGMAAAVANAIFHATGKRVRDLPITIDKLLT